MASAIPSLLIFLVLLVSPYLGSSYHTSYTHGGKHYAIRSNSDPRQPKQNPTCRPSSSDGVPVLHRLSPCSPHSAAAPSEDTTTVADVFHRDALRLRSLFGDNENHGAPAPGPSAPGVGGGVSIPSRGDPKQALPGAFEYHVAVGFGTPVQQLAVGFDTFTSGATLLKCTQCAAMEPCDDEVFEPSASSTVRVVPCGSSECPFLGCSAGGSCTPSMSANNTLLGNVTFLIDTLTLTSSTTLDNFRFACLEAGFRPNSNSTGVLDLSRNSHSLASRAPAYPGTVAFSYCLPSSPNAVGFLSIAPPKPELSGHEAIYTPLRTNQNNSNLYVVNLIGLGLGGDDLLVPPTAFAGDTLLDLRMTFTYLRPEAYAALRDGFRRRMAEYPVAPPLGTLDTCYNFTGLNGFTMPVVTLKFDGGADVDLSIDEIIYFPDRDNHFSVACLAFAAAPERTRGAALVGNWAQASKEVVYDVRGGKLGFVPYRC